MRHVRIECAPHIRFAAGSAVTITAGGGIAGDLLGASIGAINGLGSNAIHFSITSGTGLLKTVNRIVVSGNRLITTAGTPGSCSYALYDQPSQAATGGAAGLITTVAGSYLDFSTSYGMRSTAGGAVANVEASPAFSRFTLAAPTNDIGRANLGTVTFDTRAVVYPPFVQPLLANGVAATLADLLAPDSHHMVNCSAVTTPASVITASTARFSTGPAAIAGLSLCYARAVLGRQRLAGRPRRDHP